MPHTYTVSIEQYTVNVELEDVGDDGSYAYSVVRGSIEQDDGVSVPMFLNELRTFNEQHSDLITRELKAQIEQAKLDRLP